MGNKKKRNTSKIKNEQDPMAVTWTENYDKVLTKFWTKLPKSVRSVSVIVAVFVLGLAVNGDWVNIFVHALKYSGYMKAEQIIHNDSLNWHENLVVSLRMQNFLSIWLGANFVSYFIYFFVGGFIHWHFYVKQRDRPEDWKCQPKKWLAPDLERHEIIFGSATLFVNGSLSAVVACYISNGGYSTVYYGFTDYPWWWTILQIPIVFIYQDYTTYLLHRMYHTPFLYKHFHKLHHKYKQPTAFSVTAIHPIESINIQMTYLLPIFVVPVHWLIYYVIMIYVYYHGIIDHSGVNFKAFWWQPWQPDAIFHDNHHQYFHVNFGFNCFIWDKLHGTYRRKDRVYTEDIYYGRGKALDDVTKSELAADIAERNSENPLAYRGGKLEFKLTGTDLKSSRSSS